jgi:hypothetical protein
MAHARDLRERAMSALLWCVAVAGAPEIVKPETVQQRTFEDTRKVEISAGGVWLSRFDSMSSPGVSVQVTHHVSRNFAIDSLSAAWFFTFRSEESLRLERELGFRSNRETPQALVGIGGRYGFGYGKLLIEASKFVVHFIPEISLHLGGMVTRTALRPAFDVGVGVRVAVGSRVRISLGYEFVGSLEGRRYRFVAGGMPRVQLGVAF